MSKKASLIIVSVLTLFTLVSGILLLGDKNFDFFAFHSYPVCQKDYRVFTSSVCDSCHQTVENAGFFRSNLEDTQTVAFSDRFSSWKDYKHKLAKDKFLSGIFLLSIISTVSFVMLVLYERSTSKTENDCTDTQGIETKTDVALTQVENDSTDIENDSTDTENDLTDTENDEKEV